MELTERRRRLIMAIWSEQYAAGIGPDYPPDESYLVEWLTNRIYARQHYFDLLDRVAVGDAAAIAEIRYEAGLPPLV